MPDIWELYDFWLEWPPVYMLTRWMSGFKPKPKFRRDGPPVLNEAERLTEAQSNVIPFERVPAYVREAMQKHKDEQDKPEPTRVNIL